jgi:hypothetical protein
MCEGREPLVGMRWGGEAQHAGHITLLKCWMRNMVCGHHSDLPAGQVTSKGSCLTLRAFAAAAAAPSGLFLAGTRMACQLS